MACNIEKAIDALLEFEGTASHVKRIIAESLLAEKEFSTFKVEKVVNAISKEYPYKFTQFIRKETGIDITYHPEFVRDYVSGIADKFEQGRMYHTTNTIQLVDPAEVLKFIKETETSLENKELTTVERNKLVEVLDKLSSHQSQQVLLHELIHAITMLEDRKQAESEIANKPQTVEEGKSTPDETIEAPRASNEADKATELFSIAQDEGTEYNAATKEAAIQLINTHPSISLLLRDLGIDIKDC